MVPTQRAISQLPASATRSARSSSRYERTRSRAVSITRPDDPVAAPAVSSPGRLAKAPSLAGYPTKDLVGGARKSAVGRDPGAGICFDLGAMMARSFPPPARRSRNLLDRRRVADEGGAADVADFVAVEAAGA